MVAHGSCFFSSLITYPLYFQQKKTTLVPI